jgi:hypothetical protein
MNHASTIFKLDINWPDRGSYNLQRQNPKVLNGHKVIMENLKYLAM